MSLLLEAVAFLGAEVVLALVAAFVFVFLRRRKKIMQQLRHFGRAVTASERERFEADAMESGWRNFSREETGAYCDLTLELRWQGWQAAVALR